MIILFNTEEGEGAPDHRPVPRMTHQRRAIVSILGELQSFQSAQEIHALLKERGETIGLATVYRYLARMVKSGDVDVMNREDGESVYMRCSRQHHHHLACRRCGRAIEIGGPAIEQWAEQLAAQHGYTDVTHALEIFGVCPDCAESGGDTR